MPLTDLFALIQSKPAVLLAGFLSSLCLLLLATGPYMVRAYRKQGRRFSGDAGTAPSEELHCDPPNTWPVPTVSYSMLTAETGHHIGHQLRLGNVQSAAALYRFWESLSPSIEDPTSREFACTFAKAIEEAQECASTSAQPGVACDQLDSDVANFHRAVWHTVNDLFGSVQIAALERCMVRSGYRFGSDASLEVALPMSVQRCAAEEMAEDRLRHLYSACSEDEVTEAVKQERKDSYCLSLIAFILRAARDYGRFVQEDAAQFTVADPANSRDISDESRESSIGIPDQAEHQQAWSISFRLARLKGTHRYDQGVPDGHTLHELIEEAAALHGPTATNAGYEARAPQR